MTVKKVSHSLLKTAHDSQQGFTLVELLIVIAVLGVLAAVILVAINPLEQLGRGRDAGRISAVNQLAHAMNNYYTATQQTQYPVTSGAWQNILTGAGSSSDIQNVLTVPQSGSYAGPAATCQGYICYKPYNNVGTNDAFLVWAALESQANRSVYATKAGGVCAAANYVLVAYDSYAGKVGYSCQALNAAPTGGSAGNIYF